MIGLIWAQARDAAGRPVIGAAGSIPWRVPEDFAHFQATTSGHPVVMGRRTWDSLPARSRPLPGRTNIVVTRQPDWLPDGEGSGPGTHENGTVLVAGSLDAGLALATAAPGDEEAWVIGGSQIYAEAMALADACVVTDIDLVVEGDSYAPEPDGGWQEAWSGPWQTSRTGTRYRVRVLERTGDSSSD